MKANYVAIYKLNGVSQLGEGLPDPPRIIQAVPLLSVSLTTTPEPHFEHIDRSHALMNMMFTGGISSEGADQRLIEAIDTIKAKRTKKTVRGVFAVFIGDVEIDEPDQAFRSDPSNYGTIVDAVPNSQIREGFQHAQDRMLLSYSLAIPSEWGTGVEKMGSTIFLTASADSKPIYSYSFQGFPVNAYASGTFAKDMVDEAYFLAKKLEHHDGLAASARLLNQSLNKNMDRLQAFIAAWCALEMFINKFVKNKVPPSGFEISNEDNLKNKELKVIRNDLFHEMKIPDALPTEDIQKQLLKYLKLYVKSSQLT